MKEGPWLKSLLSKVFEPFTHPITLFSDNQAMIVLRMTEGSELSQNRNDWYLSN
jgi:hypothetical protein